MVRQKQPSGAQAPTLFQWLVARVNSCPSRFLLTGIFFDLDLFSLHLFSANLLDRGKQIIQTFGQRWMRKDSLAQRLTGHFPHHRHFQHGHQFATFYA